MEDVTFVQPVQGFNAGVLSQLDRCVLKYVRKGTYGLTFEATFKEGHTVLEDNHGRPEKQFLLKVAYLHTKDAEDYAKKYKLQKEELTVEINGHDEEDSITSSLEKDFLKEVKVQGTIFEKSIEHFGYPLCPAVFDFQIMKGSVSDSLIEQMRRAGVKIYFPKTPVHGKNRHLGLLAMEYLPDAGYISEKDKDMARALLLKMAWLGYSHNDASLNNYLKARGRVYLIDFGMSKRLSSDLLENVRKWIKEKRYNHVFHQLFKFGYAKEKAFNSGNYKNYFRWVKTGRDRKSRMAVKDQLMKSQGRVTRSRQRKAPSISDSSAKVSSASETFESSTPKEGALFDTDEEDERF
jgi:tRNA A-37 threonylcarbamoyl transferase component Bud32